MKVDPIQIQNLRMQERRQEEFRNLVEKLKKERLEMLRVERNRQLNRLQGQNVDVYC